MKKNRPSKTAELAAFTRHLALSCPAVSSILVDPFARWFIGYSFYFPYLFIRRGLNTARLQNWLKDKQPLGLMFPVCRHRFMNDLLLTSLDDGYNQIILIGAGYDSTAIRFQNRLFKAVFIEIDYPATQKRKIRILKRHPLLTPSFVRYIPADLGSQRISQVLQEVISKDKKTLILAEGVLSYLERANVNQLISDCAHASSAVRFAADYRYAALNRKETPKRAKQWLSDFRGRGESYQTFFEPDDMNELVRQAGFSIQIHRNLAEVWRTFCPVLTVPAHLENAAGIIVGQK